MNKLVLTLCIGLVLFSSFGFATHEKKWKGGPCNDANGVCIKASNEKYSPILDDIKKEYYKDHADWMMGFSDNPLWEETKKAWADATASCYSEYDSCLLKPHEDKTMESNIEPIDCSQYQLCLSISAKARYLKCEEEGSSNCRELALSVCTNPTCAAIIEPPDFEGNVGDSEQVEQIFSIDIYPWDTIEFDDKTDGILRCSSLRTKCFNAAATASDKMQCDNRQDDCIERVERLREDKHETPEEKPDEPEEELFPNEIRIRSVSGDVEFNRGGEAPFQTLEEGQLLLEGFQISTGLDSWVVLEFPNGEVVKVRDLTLLHIDEYYFGEDQSRTVLNLRTGAVQAQVPNRRSVRADFSVQTPTLTASVRGTNFEVSYEEDSEEGSVKTYEGTVVVEDEYGHSIDLSAGEEVAVSDTLGEVFVFDESLQKSNLSSALLWVVALIIVIGSIAYWLGKRM